MAKETTKPGTDTTGNGPSAAEFLELQESNQSLTMLVEEMADKLNRLQNAQLAGVGVDPAMAARATLKRVMVQFKEHYNRGAVPSAIQKDAILIPSYWASRFDVVLLPEDEVARINNDFPGLLETDRSKFVTKPKFRFEQGRDDNGRIGWKRIPIPVKVDKLIEQAQEMG